MDENIFDEAQYALTILETAAMAYETGRPDILEYLSNTPFDRDVECEFALNGMYRLCDFMSEYYSEDTEVCAMYFSSNAMMENYRLCREYGKLKGISLKENPYMLRALEEVRAQMSEDGCYYCCSWLQTKVNHKWASGIVFKYDVSYFCEFLALFSRLLYVFEFYDRAVKDLRKEVETLKRQKLIPFPASQKEREAA